VNLAVLSLGLLAILGWFVLLPWYWARTGDFRPGDVLFQSLPHNRLVDTIEGVTRSPLSHCGLVVEREGELRVLEAIGPVKETGLFTWIRRGRGYRFSVYRLRPPWRDRVDAVIAEARRHLGKPYDALYEMDDGKIYCSELIYKAFLAATGERLGKTCTLGSLDWRPWEESILRFAHSARPPLERVMITPAALARAPQLEKVRGRGL
jgi:hypothetical protein